ncbi:MAG: hypothetical protein ACP5N3_00410 [Candidatus Nanoarchaeia archaeon]
MKQGKISEKQIILIIFIVLILSLILIYSIFRTGPIPPRPCEAKGGICTEKNNCNTTILNEKDIRENMKCSSRYSEGYICCAPQN